MVHCLYLPSCSLLPFEYHIMTLFAFKVLAFWHFYMARDLNEMENQLHLEIYEVLTWMEISTCDPIVHHYQ
jgi:hypothetical protein